MFKVLAQPRGGGGGGRRIKESNIYRILGTGMGFRATTRGRRGNPIATAGRQR